MAAVENILVYPGGLQQLLPRERPLRGFEKGEQQGVLALAQRDRRAVGSASFRPRRSSSSVDLYPPRSGSLPVRPVPFPAAAALPERARAIPQAERFTM